MICNSTNCNCKITKSAKKDYSDIWRQKEIDREWEMAGLARQDGDKAAELYHTQRARDLASS